MPEAPENRAVCQVDDSAIAHILYCSCSDIIELAFDVITYKANDSRFSFRSDDIPGVLKVAKDNRIGFHRKVLVAKAIPKRMR